MQEPSCSNKVYRWFDKWLASVSKSKHSIEKASSTQSANSTKRFKSAYYQATLHSFMIENTTVEIVAKHVAVNRFLPSAVCKSEFSCQAFSDKGML